MKSWKKLFALLMALAMLFAFAACSESDEGEDDTPKANASIQKYVDENRSDILEGMESGFVSSSGMTCSSDIQVVGDGIVITFNINELEDLSADEKEHYQSLYDAQAALLNTLLPTMQTEIPELEYFTINICEKDGTKIATVTIDGKNSGNLNPNVKPNPDPTPLSSWRAWRKALLPPPA